tara:strand:+ start:1220 stop:1450 length:231 start_codon:yes stop_codon:yes gene_type:complete
MFYDYKMSPNFTGQFKTTSEARRDFSKKWYNLRSNTSLNRFNRHEWNNTFDAIDDLAKADLKELQQPNQIIKGDLL